MISWFDFFVYYSTAFVIIIAIVIVILIRSIFFKHLLSPKVAKAKYNPKYDFGAVLERMNLPYFPIIRKIFTVFFIYMFIPAIMGAVTYLSIMEKGLSLIAVLTGWAVTINPMVRLRTKYPIRYFYLLLIIGLISSVAGWFFAKRLQ